MIVLVISICYSVSNETSSAEPTNWRTPCNPSTVQGMNA